jgi:CrcB protein
MNSIFVFFGAGVGGVFRYWVSLLFVFFFGKQFPSGTLFINVSGSFLIGLGTVLIFHRFPDSASSLRFLLLVGMLGGYTTFSAFSLETLDLLQTGHYAAGILNIILSICLSLFAVWLGMTLGKQWE